MRLRSGTLLSLRLRALRGLRLLRPGRLGLGTRLLRRRLGARLGPWSRR